MFARIMFLCIATKITCQEIKTIIFFIKIINILLLGLNILCMIIMKKFIDYFKDYFKTEKNLTVYIILAIFLCITITLNYIYDFENVVLDSFNGKVSGFFVHILFYGFAYYFTLFIIIRFEKNYEMLNNKKFWFSSIFIILILANSSNFTYFESFILGKVYYSYKDFTKQVLRNIDSFFIIILPLYIFYKTYHKDQEIFYGITLKNTTIKPYVILLAILAPFIFLISFAPNFIKYYPVYNGHGFVGTQSVVMALLFELVYGLDFISVELLFRGFMVIGIAKFIGKKAVLPMVVTYAFLHFGKPPGETISSIFGGFILGVIALYSKNIWGGIFIHVGVAWFMELFAYFQKLLRH